MTIYVSNIERLRGLQESSFATDGSGSMGSFFEIPFNEGTCSLILDEPVESPKHAQQRIGGSPTGVIMPRKSTLSFQTNLETFTTKATSTVAATSHWLAEMLEAGLGGSHLMTGTVTTTGATTTSIPVSVATTCRPGAAIGLNTGSGSALEIREIKSKSGSTLTLKHATSNSASTSATVYGTTTLFAHTRMTGADSISMQFALEGQNIEDRYLVRGGALDSLTMTFGPGLIPKLTWAWKLVDWDQADGASTSGDLTGSVITAATYINTVTLVQADSELRSHTVGTSSLSSTLLEANQIELRPNIVWAPVMTSSGTNTVKQWVRVHAEPVVTGSVVLPYEDAQTWFAARTAKTMKTIGLQIGSSTTNGGCLLSVPKVQIDNVARENVEGIQNQRFSFRSLLDTDTTAESSYEALAESPWRWHFA